VLFLFDTTFPCNTHLPNLQEQPNVNCALSGKVIGGQIVFALV